MHTTHEHVPAVAPSLHRFEREACPRGTRTVFHSTSGPTPYDGSRSAAPNCPISSTALPSRFASTSMEAFPGREVRPSPGRAALEDSAASLAPPTRLPRENGWV